MDKSEAFLWALRADVLLSIGKKEEAVNCYSKHFSNTLQRLLDTPHIARASANFAKALQ